MKGRRKLAGTFRNHTYSVPMLVFFEYQACSEKAYDREAMRKIEAHSLALLILPFIVHINRQVIAARLYS